MQSIQIFFLAAKVISAVRRSYGMVAAFIQEQKRYTKKDLCKKFHCSEEKTTSITSRLQTFGFLRTVRYSNIQKDMTDLFNEDSEADDLRCSERECLYVFLFVGVLMVSDILLKCYPKYILHKSEPKDELRQILKVIEKYNAKEQRMPIFCETDESHSFHLLYVLCCMSCGFCFVTTMKIAYIIRKRTGLKAMVLEKFYGIELSMKTLSCFFRMEDRIIPIFRQESNSMIPVIILDGCMPVS